MQIVKLVIGWIARHFVLWILLIGALLVWNAWQVGAEQELRAAKLEETLAAIEVQREAGEEALRQAEADARGRSVEVLETMLADAKADRARLVSQRRSDLKRRASIALADSDAIIADQTLELEIAVATRKIAGLERSIAATEAQMDRAAMMTAAIKAWREADTKWRNAVRTCDAANAAVKRYEARRGLGRFFGSITGEGRRLRASRDDKCSGVAALAARAERVKEILDETRKGGAAVARAGAWSQDRLESADTMLREAVAREREGADGSARAQIRKKWADWGMTAILWQAFVALLLIIAMPYLIRLLFWFVLAPIAERRPSIRIAVPGGIGAPMPPADASRTSIAVQLGAGEELLVRQDYLQSSSVSGAKETQWMLDLKHPLSSLASGLWFLTRIRGAGEVTTISAVHDPFAEVTEVTLPENGAAVLHPRALAAVVQKEGQPLKITSHWRLFSLNAWLTMQLRFLVFHGPARLVIKGGRGVRVEPAGAGRIFGQDQLVGFSAELAYAVARTETFWPYFLGREQLLKDRVLDGEGMLIVEEAPMAGRKGQGPRSGLEGTMDAALKAVGL
ncbi:hypothetical protein [Croceicoccus gelatinilyticus]|uniref:hypothetical protein n=1 Tax=Croceicoccus gelatinilyticus TaxID=2835536 RepID=UPI001BD1B6E5|nr:hypothetical protein [Croceicoccus gelatinilyticus]MBS7669653.1 hypothetical protein [Croceicoccus gelatinilyticus]